MSHKRDLVQRLYCLSWIFEKKGLDDLLQIHIFNLTMYEWIFYILTRNLRIKKDVLLRQVCDLLAFIYIFFILLYGWILNNSYVDPLVAHNEKIIIDSFLDGLAVTIFLLVLSGVHHRHVARSGRKPSNHTDTAV